MREVGRPEGLDGPCGLAGSPLLELSGSGPGAAWSRRGDHVDRWQRWRQALDPVGQSRDVQAGAAPSDARCCVTLKQRHSLGELAGLRETGDLAHVDLRERVHDCAFLTGVEYRRDAWWTGGLLRCSGGAVGQRRLHGRAGLEGAEDLHGRDGGAGGFRGDIAGGGGEADNLECGAVSRNNVPNQDPTAYSATARG